MFNGNPKRIVVIKDINSNIIEEAILILKGEATDKEGIAAFKDTKNKKGNDFLLREAEMIINNYIKECRAQSGLFMETEKKSLSISKHKIPVNTVINTALISSIVLLIFLITRMF